MTRLLPKLLLLMLSVMVTMRSNAETDLAGYWQHESDPLWIEMQPEAGQGHGAQRQQADRLGFLVVTDLEAAMAHMNGLRWFSLCGWGSTAQQRSP